RQREFQLEQARYEVRLAQRQYDAVDPSNRLVAAELERRWNEKLERVAQLERTYTQAERDAEWKLTAEERAAITDLSGDLPAFWHDNQSHREAGCTGRRLAEDASGSRFPDSRNGSSSHLRGDCCIAQSCRSAQCLWSAFHHPAYRIYLPAGRTDKK